MTARCPVCRGELVVGGEGVTEDITLFYWCPYCNAARNPAPRTTPPRSAAPRDATQRNVLCPAAARCGEARDSAA
jgi:hypothetical protein